MIGQLAENDYPHSPDAWYGSQQVLQSIRRRLMRYKAYNLVRFIAGIFHTTNILFLTSLRTATNQYILQSLVPQ